eukprot:738804_1
MASISQHHHWPPYLIYFVWTNITTLLYAFSSFGHFWKQIAEKGLRSDGIMSLETCTDILHGSVSDWIDYQENVFHASRLSVSIMRADLSLSAWKTYYRDVLVGKKNADDVVLEFPGPSPELWRKAKSKTKKHSKAKKTRKRA